MTYDHARYRPLWLASRYDKFSTTGVRDAFGNSGRFADHQIEARVRLWLIPKRLRLEWSGPLLAKGRLLHDAPNAVAGGDTIYNSFNAKISFWPVAVGQLLGGEPREADIRNRRGGDDSTRPKVDVANRLASGYKLTMVEIRTDRLLLRKAREDDLGPFHAILSDIRAMAFWYRPPHENLAVTQTWLADMMEIDPSIGEDFAVEFEGRLIGKAGLRKFPTVGFIFHPDVWGRGLAEEALRPIINRAFSEHGLPMIEADVDPRNGSSLRLLTRLGFVETGRARRTSLVGGEWCDSVFLCLHSAGSNGS